MLAEPAVGLIKRSAHPVGASTVLNINVLKAFEKVKSDDGSNLVIELIDIYLAHTPQRIEEMRNASANEEWPVLKRLAHTLKGSSSTLGLHGVADACRQLESFSRTSGTALHKLLATLDSQFAEAQEALIAERERWMG
jgi:HPt (histidine-containing phosphotransfer) domain-containing protein